MTLAQACAESVLSDDHAAVVTDQEQLTPEQELVDNLEAADNWVTVVRLLNTSLGLSQADIARGARVSQVTVARWLDGNEQQEVRARARVDDLRYVVLWLLKTCRMRLRLAGFWLKAKNIDLRTDPLSAIAEGRYEEVVEAARAFAAGRRPSR
jgi:transcriptional regulator with XRE-family HTH domain